MKTGCLSREMQSEDRVSQEMLSEDRVSQKMLNVDRVSGKAECRQGVPRNVALSTTQPTLPRRTA